MQIFILLLTLATSCLASAAEKILIFATTPAMESFLATSPLEIRAVLPEIKMVVVRQNSQIFSLSQNHDISAIQDPVQIKIDPIQSNEDLGRLWGLRAIEADKAWKFSTGENIVVAVSDTGIWQNHPDLKPNFWQNPGEIPGNDIDDDKNGFVDDVRGWNFVDNNSNPDDSHHHGTHVAGTIAAANNGFGVIGVSPRVKLMAVKFIASNGSGSDYNAAQSILYAAKNGAKIINCSWGSNSKSKAIHAAIEFAHSKGVLVIAAAGNENRDTDRKPHSPSTLPFENIIAVGATSDAHGTRASFSNYGKKSVDIAAPGESIYSTVKPSGNPLDKSEYARLSGTSMAAPHVSGLAALIWSLRPQMKWSEVKATILKTGSAKSNWKYKSVTGKVIHARSAVESIY